MDRVRHGRRRGDQGEAETDGKRIEIYDPVWHDFQSGGNITTSRTYLKTTPFVRPN
jgi:hypothetical protein